MGQYTAPLRDMQFVLHELLGVEDHLKQMPQHAEIDADTINQVIEEAGKFCSEVIFPINQSGDREGCTYHGDGVVTAPKGFKEAYQQYVEGGWPALGCDPEYGGQGLPILINNAVYEMLNSANQAWTMYPGLSHGAYEALHAHGTDELKQRYLPKLVSGVWTGTMCLTEPHCGTDLGILRTKAEPLGQPITEAIITVPAYFSDAQRKATRAAGVMAGLKVDRLLNEPTAAALAYGIHQLGAETRFLVFDLGGGTFDVSVLDMFEGVMEVRASAGDNFLGGEDFVACIIDRFFEQAKAPAKLKTDTAFMQQLTAQVEAAKRALSEQPAATIEVAHNSDTYTLELDEATFEQICAPLLQRLRAPVERALRDANLRGTDLDKIVLAGGATRMPVVRRMVARMFGRFPECEINPDEVVALGAAVQAGLKMKDAALDDVVMTDVAPYSLGVAVAMQLPDGSYTDGHFDPIIERNSPVPISRVKTYSPIREQQRAVDLHVYQGEARLVTENIQLGTLKVPLPDLPRAQCAVDVRFTYDVNGLLQVEATV